MSQSSESIRYYLKTAFEYEVRNKLAPRMDQLNKIDELDEEQSDELRFLQTVQEYLHKRIGEMQI
jgi:hypothetical protein